VLWSASLVAAVAVLWTNPLADLVRFSQEAGLVVRAERLKPALAVLCHPVTLAGISLVALGSSWAERRLGNAPEFPLGLLVGMLGVLLTAALAALVLVLDDAHRWGPYATALVLAHLPLALVEGLVLGCTVGFLARVKPELLGMRNAECGVRNEEPGLPHATLRTPHSALALVLLLLVPGSARAHGLEVSYRIDHTAKKVVLTAFFETGDAPQKGAVKVLRADGSVLAEGTLDADGRFEFTYETPEDLKVRITVPGHPEVVAISAAELAGAAARHGDPRARWRDLAVGVSLVLALAAFVLALRANRRARHLSSVICHLQRTGQVTNDK
jgi:hypothetical protein